MTKTITKTAAAAFAAAFALTGAAFADDAVETDKIYALMDAVQAKTAETINASAQEQVLELSNALNETDATEQAESYTLASS